jgi:hypothetical protein
MLATAPLPETKTHKDWAYYWAATPTSPHDGVVRIVETTGKRVVREIADVYEVSEQLGDGVPGRRFILLKTEHTGDLDTVKGRESAKRVGEFYTLDLLADGRVYCTCPAGVSRAANGHGPCCHAIAVGGVIADGHLPHPLDRAGNTGEDAANTEESTAADLDMEPTGHTDFF